jgi:hypothetical protein
MNSYEILTGVGTLYVAPVGTAFPLVDATPGAAWTNLGETNGGVKVSYEEKITEIRTDQRTGPVKPIRTEEGMTVETKLAQATLENLAKVQGQTATTTAAGVGTPGTHSVPLYKGKTVQEYAFLFKTEGSPYGAYPAQFQLPRGYFDSAGAIEFKKDGNAEIPVKFVALEDLNAATSADRFGKIFAQHALAT